jgi:microcin C transport system permease protein
MAAFKLSPLSKRRWKNFKANRRAYYSLLIFVFLTVIASMAEFVANDKPLIASYRGDIFSQYFLGL